MRTSQRVSRQIRATIKPIVASVKRRYSNENSSNMITDALTIAVPLGFMFINYKLDEYKRAKKQKIIDENRTSLRNIQGTTDMILDRIKLLDDKLTIYQANAEVVVEGVAVE